MKNILLVLIIIAGLLSCEKEKRNINRDTEEHLPAENTDGSEDKSLLSYHSSISMEDGPHDLLIYGSDMYAVRDHKIFLFSISKPEKPILQKNFTLGNGAARFGKLYRTENKLYIPCQTDGHLYEFNTDLSLIKKHDLNIASFKPNIVLKDDEGHFWIGGSNGSKGILAKYDVSPESMTLSAHWIASGNDSNIESAIEKNDHIITSIPKGELLSFQKTNVAAGPVDIITYENEAGHEKWGHTLIHTGNKAYWANWGAGLATIDITNPAHLSVNTVLSNSLFKSQFADAEGTNVYDIAYNAKHDILCIANGWSGVLLVQQNTPDQVLAFSDPQYFQNRCIETAGDYIYTGNISGGMSGDLKGIKIFKINM